MPAKLRGEVGRLKSWSLPALWMLLGLCIGGVLTAQSFEGWQRSQVIPVVLVKPSFGSFVPVDGSSLDASWTKSQVVPMCQLKPGSQPGAPSSDRACQEYRRRGPFLRPLPRRDRSMPFWDGRCNPWFRLMAALISPQVPRRGRCPAGDRFLYRRCLRVARQSRAAAFGAVGVACKRGRSAEILRYRLAQRRNRRLRERPSPGIATTAAGGWRRDFALCE